MPIYKGTVEVTSGNLHKGSTEIENGYKGADPFYLNETTVSFLTPTGQGLTYTQPNPQSSTGSPGATFPNTTFTITSGSNAMSGTAIVAGLPTGLTVTGQSYNNSSPGNILTITIGGTFPTTSSIDTALVISGLRSITYYTVTLNYANLSIPSGTSAVASTTGSGGISSSRVGTTYTVQFPAGTSISVVASYSAGQSGTGNSSLSFRQRYFNGGYSGGAFGVSQGFSMTGGAPGLSASHSVSSNSQTLNSNLTVDMSGGYSILAMSIWGYDAGPGTPTMTASTGVATQIGSAQTYGAWNSVNRQANFNGPLVYMDPPGGGAFGNGSISGFIPSGTNPGNLQISSNNSGTYGFSFSWGGGAITFTCTFS